MNEKELVQESAIQTITTTKNLTWINIIQPIHVVCSIIFIIFFQLF